MTDHATEPMNVTFNRPCPEFEVRGPDGVVRAASIIDTGGGGLILAEGLARSIGLPIGETLSEGGETFALAPAPEIFLGDYRIDHGLSQVAVAVGREAIFSFSASSLFIPGRVLARHHVVFDYPAGTFTMGSPGALRPRGVAVPTPIGPTGFPRIEVELGDESVGLLLDTGASATMLSPALMDRLAAANPGWPTCTGAVGAANMGQVGMERSVTTMRIGSASCAAGSLGDIIAVSRPPGTFESYMSPMMTAPILGALGGDALRRFRVEIDYASGTTYLEPSAVRPEAVSGVGLIVGGDGEVALAEGADQKTQRAVQEGDRLHAVDGTPIGGRPSADVVVMLAGNVGESRTVVVRRGSELVDLGPLPVVVLLPLSAAAGVRTS